MQCSSLTAGRRHGLSIGLVLALALVASSVEAQRAPRWAHPQSSRRAAPGDYTSSASFIVAVPLFMDVDRDVVRPGASLEGRFGLKLGWLMPEIELGFAWVPIDLREIVPGSFRDPLKRFFFGLGVRLQPPNAKTVIPYLSGSFNFNWWNFQETSYGCGYWYCSTFDRYRFTPGFSGRVGMTIRPRPAFGIDLGLGVGMSFAGDFFFRNEWWLSPYAGFTVFY